MDESHEEQSHPAPRYWLVLIGLVVLTAIEVGVSYLTGGIKIGLLLALALAKALLVVLYFMHLKFDSRLYTVLFVLGFLLVAPLLVFILAGTPK